VRDFVRPDPALVKGFDGIPTGVVSDAMGRGNSMAAEILAKAQAGVAKERQLRERIAQGEFIFDILKLDGVLKSLGVVEW